MEPYQEVIEGARSKPRFGSSPTPDEIDLLQAPFDMPTVSVTFNRSDVEAPFPNPMVSVIWPTS